MSTQNALAGIARQSGSLLDHVIACDGDGIPTLSLLAPDVCENEPLPALAHDTGVEVWSQDGSFLCVTRARWAAKQVAAGVLVRSGERSFTVA